MDTPARLLRLLVLFSTRPSWRADELTERLEVTPRTLRRDVTRLRDLGYPIESTTGRYGGYSLGSGGRLPPLLFDDDEAVAMWSALRHVSVSADPMLGEAAVSALAKLGEVLPSGLRERIDALGDVTIDLAVGSGGSESIAAIDTATLTALASACRAELRLRFEYRTGEDVVGRRHVEPHRLVSLRRRWYLVAWDLDRDAWRTFRVDRVTSPVLTGQRSTPRQHPDPAGLVSEGVAVRVYEVQATVLVHAPPHVTRREIGPSMGVIRPGDEGDETTIVSIGGDNDWLARYLVGLPFRVEVLDPVELRAEIRRLARRRIREHA